MGFGDVSWRSKLMYGLEVRGNLKLPFGGNDESAWMAGTLIGLSFQNAQRCKSRLVCFERLPKFWGDFFLCFSPDWIFLRNTALSVSEFLEQRRDADLVFDERTQAVD